MHLCSKTCAQAHWSGLSTPPDCRSWWGRRSRSADSKRKSGNILMAPLRWFVPSLRSMHWPTHPAQLKTSQTALAPRSRTYRYGSQSLAEQRMIFSPRVSRIRDDRTHCGLVYGQKDACLVLACPSRCFLRSAPAGLSSTARALKVPNSATTTKVPTCSRTPAMFSGMYKTSVWGPHDRSASTSHGKGKCQ